MRECQKKHRIVNLIIKKLKSKHTSLKEYTNWAKLIYFSLVLGEWEEKKPKYFAPKQRQMKLEDFLKFYELAFSGYLNFM